MERDDQYTMTATVLIVGADGLSRDVKGRVHVTASGLDLLIDTALPVLTAYRTGELPAEFASLGELLASFGDEQLCLRKAGTFQSGVALHAEGIEGECRIVINVPSERLVSLVTAIRALNNDRSISNVCRD